MRLTFVEIVYKIVRFLAFITRIKRSTCKRSVLDERKNMEHWWNYGKRKPKYREREISQRPFIFHKSHMDFPGTEQLVSAVKPRQNNFINVTVHPSCFEPKWKTNKHSPDLMGSLNVFRNKVFICYCRCELCESKFVDEVITYIWTAVLSWILVG